MELSDCIPEIRICKDFMKSSKVFHHTGSKWPIKKFTYLILFWLLSTRYHARNIDWLEILNCSLHNNRTDFSSYYMTKIFIFFRLAYQLLWLIYMFLTVSKLVTVFNRPVCKKSQRIQTKNPHRKLHVAKNKPDNILNQSNGCRSKTSPIAMEKVLFAVYKLSLFIALLVLKKAFFG